MRGTLSFYRKRPLPSASRQAGDDLMKSGVIFGVVLVIILAAIVVSHQMSDGGNDHFDKAGENWKQN